jgi:sortase A
MTRPLLIACVLAVGLWQIAAAASIHAKAWLGQALMERAWHESRQRDKPVPPWPGSVSHPIARIKVPALDVDHLVLEGADTPVLAWGPGMEVGPDGHRLIAAHRDTHFRFLQHLEPGALVHLELASGQTEHWQVEGQRIVDSRRVGLDLAASGDRMTWVTCWPFDAIEAGGPLRLLVTLERVGASSKHVDSKGVSL